MESDWEVVINCLYEAENTMAVIREDLFRLAGAVEQHSAERIRDCALNMLDDLDAMTRNLNGIIRYAGDGEC